MDEEIHPPAMWGGRGRHGVPCELCKANSVDAPAANGGIQVDLCLCRCQALFLSTLSVDPFYFPTSADHLPSAHAQTHSHARALARTHTLSLFLSLFSGGWTKAVSSVTTASGDVSSVFARRALAGIIRIGRPHLNGQSLREKPRLQLVQLSQTSQSAFCLKMGAAVDPSSRRLGRLCKGAKARHVLLPL